MGGSTLVFRSAHNVQDGLLSAPLFPLSFRVSHIVPVQSHRLGMRNSTEVLYPFRTVIKHMLPIYD